MPTTFDVLAGRSPWGIDLADCREWLATMPPASVDLVFGSPPYPMKGKRYPGQDRPRRLTEFEWVELMTEVSAEARRVCRGDVVWVVSAPVQGGRYCLAVERLLVAMDGLGHRPERPAIWHKNSAPNRMDWFSNDWEHLICFPAPGKRKVWNWEAVASAPKFTSGGRFRQRNARGERVGGGAYPQGKLARPRDVLRVTVGGGHMGYDAADDGFATRGEAPFPVKLVEPFVLALTDPGALVADPFAGSGTTARVCLEHGRKFVGCDVRRSQIDLASERLEHHLNHKEQRRVETPEAPAPHRQTA